MRRIGSDSSKSSAILPSRSRKRMLPASGCRRAETQLSSVVLPEPDSPTTPKTSPGHSAKETSRQATCVPNDLHSPSTWRSGGSSGVAAGPEELQGRIHVHLRVVEFRDRRGPHEIAVIDQHRVIIGGDDAAIARDVLVETDMHGAVLAQCMHLAGLALARLKPAQRLGD